MKKIITACLLVIPLAVFAEDFTVKAPEWKDFTPPAFSDVKEPKGLGKLNVTATYWYNRRIEFEEAISACNELEANDERFKCYEKVKVMQYTANSEYNAKLEAKMNPQIQEMRNPTDTMLPIGNYLNTMTRNMPNEFR